MGRSDVAVANVTTSRAEPSRVEVTLTADVACAKIDAYESSDCFVVPDRIPAGEAASVEPWEARDVAEVLIHLRDGTHDDIVDLDVVHRVSPRLVVVDEGVLETTRFVDGSISFDAYTPETSFTEELNRTLTPEERLFTESWRLRHAELNKVRTADGADWDATGFRAPDPHEQR